MTAPDQPDPEWEKWIGENVSGLSYHDGYVEIGTLRAAMRFAAMRERERVIELAAGRAEDAASNGADPRAIANFIRALKSRSAAAQPAIDPTEQQRQWNLRNQSAKLDEMMSAQPGIREGALMAKPAKVPLVTLTITVNRCGEIDSDVRTHDNSFVDVYVGLLRVKREIERVLADRRKCPFFPQTKEDANKKIFRVAKEP